MNNKMFIGKGKVYANGDVSCDINGYISRPDDEITLVNIKGKGMLEIKEELSRIIVGKKLKKYRLYHVIDNDVVLVEYSRKKGKK